MFDQVGLIVSYVMIPCYCCLKWCIMLPSTLGSYLPMTSSLAVTNAFKTMASK